MGYSSEKKIDKILGKMKRKKEDGGAEESVPAKKKKEGQKGDGAAPNDHIPVAKDSKDKSQQNSPTGRNFTVSVALPGSIVDNAQSQELRAYLVGQLARALTVFNVDEVVVFSESTNDKQDTGSASMARVLQYLETPQYLRKAMFPRHPDLKFAGLLNPLDAPHHMRASDHALYREGVTRNRPVKKGRGSILDVGLARDIYGDKHIQPGVRVTVRMDDPDPSRVKRGKIVSPAEPRERHGLYWGYQTRIAANLSDVFSGCPYKEGYDLKIGTSERGEDATSPSFTLPPFRHAIVVLGGLGGLESCIDADSNMSTVTDPAALFDKYLNTCPSQGSRTIRTEEAILVTMAVLQSHIANNQCK